MGTYYDKVTRRCLPCPAGTYQSREGQSKCTPCPHHRDDVGMEGAKSVLECEGDYTTHCASLALRNRFTRQLTLTLLLLLLLFLSMHCLVGAAAGNIAACVDNAIGRIDARYLQDCS